MDSRGYNLLASNSDPFCGFGPPCKTFCYHCNVKREPGYLHINHRNDFLLYSFTKKRFHLAYEIRWTAQQQIILSYAETNLLKKMSCLKSKIIWIFLVPKTYRNTDGLILKTCRYELKGNYCLTEGVQSRERKSISACGLGPGSPNPLWRRPWRKIP